jgi:hypothetical protein
VELALNVLEEIVFQLLIHVVGVQILVVELIVVEIV